MLACTRRMLPGACYLAHVSMYPAHATRRMLPGIGYPAHEVPTNRSATVRQGDSSCPKHTPLHSTTTDILNPSILRRMCTVPKKKKKKTFYFLFKRDFFFYLYFIC